MMTTNEIIAELQAIDEIAAGETVDYNAHTDSVEIGKDGCGGGGICCLVVGPAISCNIDFSEVEVSVDSFLDGIKTTYTFDIACDHHEAADFAAWLNKQGHDATVGDSTGNYVDGSCTDHDPGADEVMACAWNDYCQGR